MTGIFHGNGFVAERVDVPIYSEPDEDGQRTVTGYEPGVHINLRVYNPEFDASAFASEELVTPTTPVRVFF